MKKAVELKKEKYTIQVNYSPEAIEQKIMKFITPGGDEFEITAEEMSSILIGQVNSDLLAATFVETDRVNVVEVTRQIRVRVDRDIKKGEEIRLEYTHPYPVEFALIEEAMNLARIKKDVPAFTITKEYLDSVKDRITPEQNKFIKKFYEFFKDLFNKKK
jgi:hypothetical protein